MKYFRSDISSLTRSRWQTHGRRVFAALFIAGVCGTTIVAWQGKAALPHWMQDAVGSSAVEAALYRAMELPGVKALYPRPPAEAQNELSGLIGKNSSQEELYSLRAMEEEAALNFTAAERDWKAYAARSNNKQGAKLELANYYHRRMQADEEVQTLMDVGEMPTGVSETYVVAPEQRSWKAFERILAVAADQRLNDEAVSKAYAAWIARYPQQSMLYAREFRWLVEGKKFDAAEELLKQYRRAFPKDAIFSLKAQAMLEYRRGTVGSLEKAFAVYDKSFDPLWPAELIQSYYSLLKETHQQKRFVAEARARLAQHPGDLDAMARIFYDAQQQGNLQMAQQVAAAYRIGKEERKATWSAQELYTLATMMEGIHAYAEAARYDFALYHAKDKLADGELAPAAGLSAMVRILLKAPEEPVTLGAHNLSMYADIAALDEGPGFWNGILSLWLNSTSQSSEYHNEETRARSYFHRAKAAELLALLDKDYPSAPGRAGLHLEMIRALAGYGEDAAVMKAGEEFLTAFPGVKEETDRVAVALLMADAYARQSDATHEFALYERMLGELGGMTSGMPLTAASASVRGTVPATTIPVTSSDDVAMKKEVGHAFEVQAGEAAGISIAGAQEYQSLLERYLGRLTAVNQLPQALTVLRREQDHNPNDPLLYERLANFLAQNNLSAQQEEVYRAAMKKFQEPGWYNKLARLYLREKKREEFAALTRQVADIFHGTELEEYFGVSSEGGPQLYLELNLYAHKHFPHDLVFVRNLLQAYATKATRDPAARAALLREHWWEADDLRMEFFNELSKSDTLEAELKKLHEIAPTEREQKANPAAARELAEVEMWRSHFEESAPLLEALSTEYPADEDVGTQASSVLRSLAYFDVRLTERAVTVEKRLLAANPSDGERLARIGDIYADAGAGGSPEHENITAAAPYWRRMAEVHRGTSDGYLQAATVFWDYFQFDDALGEIRAARKSFAKPALFSYEAGAIYEGKPDYAGAVHEYTGAAIGGDENSATRLLQLAKRTATRSLVDEETAKVIKESTSTAALVLRERVLEALKRSQEIEPLLQAALAKVVTLEEVREIGAQASAHSLAKLAELSLQKQIALTTDPTEKIEVSYELAQAYEGRKDITDATRVMEAVYHAHPRLLGVVRSTTDYYWRIKERAKAIEALTDAAKVAQPELSRQFIVEAASKSNDAGEYPQARSLMAPLLDTKTGEPYNAQYLGVVAESFAQAKDDAGLKQFYLDKLATIRVAPLPAIERKENTAMFRRGLIPALTRMKDYAGAVDQYIAILSAYPEDANAAQEAALYALRYGRQEQLVSFAGSTVKASPKDSRFAVMLARVQMTFDNDAAAIDAYARAIAIRADKAEWFEAKAELEERQQQLDAACADYERLYVLSYHDAQWMVKLGEARARQGRKADAAKALESAWITGHAPMAKNYFRAASQLEAWAMLDEALLFAEMGVKAEGDNLLAGDSTPGSDDEEGAAIYTRLMTRLRGQQKALALLDAMRKAADSSPYAPGIVAQQVEKQGLAAVTDADWRKQRVAMRRQTAERRYDKALTAMADTVAKYFTPEEKSQFAALIATRAGEARASDLQQAATHASDKSKRGEDSAVNDAAENEEARWIHVADAADLKEVEAQLRKGALLATGGAPERHRARQQYQSYVELQRSRMEYTELGKTAETYAAQVHSKEGLPALIEAANAYRDAGDEADELRILRRVPWASKDATAPRENYLALLMKYDLPGFETIWAGSKDESLAFASSNYALAHGSAQVARATLTAHTKKQNIVWVNAYRALTGLYTNERGPETDVAFRNVLGEATIDQRLATKADLSIQASGEDWFYYGMRYGVYRSLAPEKAWANADPEDYLAAGLERNPAAASTYAALARAYADAGKTDAALAEYKHTLEISPNEASVNDAMALLLWHADRKEDALAAWREALTTLRRVEDKGAAPESFWNSFSLIMQHLKERGLTKQFRPDVDSVLRIYLVRNENYRSDELLEAIFKASATHAEGIDWVLSLCEATHERGLALGSPEQSSWIPKDAWEQVYLKKIAWARAAAVKTDNPYLVAQPGGYERSLALFYVERKEDAKAEALIASMESEAKKSIGEAVQGKHTDALMEEAKIVLAARGKRLGTLLGHWSEDENAEAPPFQVLRDAAARLAKEDELSQTVQDQLAIWEYVYAQGQRQHNLITADYMGLAEALLQAKDVPEAVEVLHRLTQASGDVYANYSLAAGLLEKTGHDVEAITFLSILTRGVPWNASYAVWMARAQMKAKQETEKASATLRIIAASESNGYALRAEAAEALASGGGKAASLGSGELDLLASGSIAPQQAQQPYFVAALTKAALVTKNPTEKASLLRQAIAIAPQGVVHNTGSEHRSGQVDLHLFALEAEAAAGHHATALAILQWLQIAPYRFQNKWQSGSESSTDTTTDDTGEEANADDAGNHQQVADTPNDSSTDELLRRRDSESAIESDAPLPGAADRSATERLELALTIAHVYEHNDDAANTLRYLKLATNLQKDPAPHAELMRQVEQIHTKLALEAKNEQRRPVIRNTLSQSVEVRPRLAALPGMAAIEKEAR